MSLSLFHCLRNVREKNFARKHFFFATLQQTFSRSRFAFLHSSSSCSYNMDLNPLIHSAIMRRLMDDARTRSSAVNLGRRVACRSRWKQALLASSLCDRSVEQACFLERQCRIRERLGWESSHQLEAR